nr:hypothetical protein [uncultured organism]
MARETKEDRVARAIFEQVAEHLHELKALDENIHTKEVDIERWSQSFLKSCLGYSATSGYSIRSQETKGKMRPDLTIYKGEKAVCVVEVKKSGFDLNKSDFRSGKIQLSEYLNTIGGVRWGMLTNGTEWKLFDFSQREYAGIEIASFDLKFEETIDLSKKALEEQCYEIYDFHETSFSSEAWEELGKEALAFSPESMAKAILTLDVVKTISRSIRGQHDYKANIEVLTDKVYELLEKGLNDAILGWNDEKAEDFKRFVKSQKRASRRTKRTKKEAPVPAVEIAVGTSPTLIVETKNEDAA